MTPIRNILGAGAVGAILMVASTLPSSAAEARGPDLAAAAQAATQAHLGESYAQYRRYGYGRGYYGRRRGYGGGAVAAGVIGGLAVGALAAGAIANSGPAYGYGYGPGYGYGYAAPAYGYGGPGTPVGNVYGADPNLVSYCASRYRSYDPRSGTYLANDGYRYPCQ